MSKRYRFRCSLCLTAECAGRLQSKHKLRAAPQLRGGANFEKLLLTDNRIGWIGWLGDRSEIGVDVAKLGIRNEYFAERRHL